MDITRRCDYACRILRSAYECGDSYISIADVAEKEDVPYSFARSIQHDPGEGGLFEDDPRCARWSYARLRPA